MHNCVCVLACLRACVFREMLCHCLPWQTPSKLLKQGSEKEREGGREGVGIDRVTEREGVGIDRVTEREGVGIDKSLIHI